MVYKLIIKKAEEGGYIGIVPEVPGAFTQGETEDEVRENIKEAIELIRESRIELALKELGESGYVVEQLEV